MRIKTIMLILILSSFSSFSFSFDEKTIIKEASEFNVTITLVEEKKDKIEVSGISKTYGGVAKYIEYLKKNMKKESVIYRKGKGKSFVISYRPQ
jgi:hypothetical protein